MTFDKQLLDALAANILAQQKCLDELEAALTEPQDDGEAALERVTELLTTLHNGTQRAESLRNWIVKQIEAK